MEDKERKTPIDFGVNRSKVKVIVTCPPSGALSDCVSFLVVLIIMLISVLFSTPLLWIHSLHIVAFLIIMVLLMHHSRLNLISCSIPDNHGNFSFFQHTVTVDPLPASRSLPYHHGPADAPFPSVYIFLSFPAHHYCGSTPYLLSHSLSSWSCWCAISGWTWSSRRMSRCRGRWWSPISPPGPASKTLSCNTSSKIIILTYILMPHILVNVWNPIVHENFENTSGLPDAREEI